eukprot:6214398-Pleurochrysis_carterae.AAC.2
MARSHHSRSPHARTMASPPCGQTSEKFSLTHHPPFRRFSAPGETGPERRRAGRMMCDADLTSRVGA